MRSDRSGWRVNGPLAFPGFGGGVTEGLIQQSHVQRSRFLTWVWVFLLRGAPWVGFIWVDLRRYKHTKELRSVVIYIHSRKSGVGRWGGAVMPQCRSQSLRLNYKQLERPLPAWHGGGGGALKWLTGVG